MEMAPNQSRESRKIWLGGDDFSTHFEFHGNFGQKVERVFQMMQDVGQRDDVETCISHGGEAVDLVAVENKVQIVQRQQIAREYVRVKTFDRRSTAADLKNTLAREIRNVAKLVPVKLLIPVKQVRIAFQLLPIFNRELLIELELISVHGIQLGILVA